MSKVLETGFHTMLETLKSLGQNEDAEHINQLYSTGQLYVHKTCRTKTINTINTNYFNKLN